MAAAGGSWKSGSFVPAADARASESTSEGELRRIGKARYSSADRTTLQYWENNRGGESGYVANYIQQVRRIEQAAARFREGG